jgi:FHS family glucose/mannose:H+ symporter-like MFS transporter
MYHSPAKPSRMLIPVFLYFLAAGIATVMLGPILPALIQRWHIQDAQAGTLFTASFAGQFIGAWFGARNLRASVLCGSAITAAGCFAMGWVGFVSAHVALFSVGLGLGAGLTAGNIIAGTTVPAARARLIAMLNAAWGVGAITCPVLVRLFAGDTRRFFFATALLLGIASLISVAIPREPSTRPVSQGDPESQPLAKSKSSGLALSPSTLFVFSASLLLYVGVENSLGGWLPSYAIRTNPSLHPSSISLCFWIAELSGRVLVTLLMAVLGEPTLYRACLALLILTQILICAIANISAAGVVTLTILAALSLAPLYPLIISFLLARTGTHVRLGPLFATASFGGATLPWLTGVFSTHFHGLRAGLLVPAAGAALLLVLSAMISARPVRPAGTASLPT